MGITKEELQAMVANMVKNIKEDTKEEKSVDEVPKDQKVEAKDSVDMEMLSKSIKAGFEEVVKSLKVEEKAMGFETKEPVENDKGGFKSLSHFARDVAKATKSGFRVVSKEFENWEKYTKAAGSPSQNESDASAGGTLIPVEFRRDMLMAVEQSNEILPRTTRVPMQTNQVSIPYINGFDESSGTVYGGLEWKWRDEEKAYTGTASKFGRVNLQLDKLTGLAYVSDELLEDSPMSMDNILMNGFRDGLSYQLSKALMRGTGAGQPLGILNAPCTIPVAKATGQAAGTIIFDNIVDMYSRAMKPSECVWMANPATLPQLVSMSLSVGTGGTAVFLPANSVSGSPHNTLFGLPLIFNKHCSNVGTIGDIVLCDWSEYLVGMKAGASEGGKFAESVHIKFDVDQVAFKFSLRTAGQPWWPTTYQPPNSAPTQSPFITLATRA